MSAAEIADNHWEVEASKPPIRSPMAIGQIAIVGGFTLFFVLMVFTAIVGAFSAKTENTLEKKLREEAEKSRQASPSAAAPAAAAPAAAEPAAVPAAAAAAAAPVQ